ncbi:MAG: DNA polymerase I [uncultured bacterium (gcode 4)]|uniref:DNA polymerase I n=1 Tax=uncultured bacterium (gcode 4) TaxID=1234023 RepID=K1XHQ7_9BACT|nr:MAG: DNA polymerase I [uncultured bacterium (gcode 4)]
MLMKIFQEKPDYFVITWDSPVKTFRHEEYPEYKANRKKMDDDFKHQIPITKAIAAELWIPSLIMPWYEADDIIFTLAKKYGADKNVLIDIYSWDKDLKYLLDTNISCVDSMKGLTTTPELFIKEYGFEPIHILEYLALVGDSADNIKWIAGIWPKKASDLIKKYQTIDNIYTHIDEIHWDIKQKLIDGKEAAYLSRGLIELKSLPEIHDTHIENFRLTLDFPKYKKILIGEHHFTSFEKTLDELKKKLQNPVQIWLF